MDSLPNHMLLHFRCTILLLAVALLCLSLVPQSAAKRLTQTSSTLYLPLTARATTPTLAFATSTSVIPSSQPQPSLGPTPLNDDLFVLSIPTGSVLQIAQNVSEISSLDWSRDGRYFSVLSAGLAIADATRKGLHQLSTDALVSSDWNPWDDRIAFTATLSGATDLYAAAPDGTQQLRISPNSTHFFAPVWSPDGTQIAAASATHLSVISSNGLQAHPIATRTGLLPYWSPDGSKIAFLSETEPGSLISTLWVANADGSGTTAISANAAGSVSDYRWSPDGSRIAYRGVSALWITDPSGTHQIHTLPANIQDFAWSPDGLQVAYTTLISVSPTIRYRLSAINADGSGERELVRPTEAILDLHGTDHSFFWAADSSQIFYIGSSTQTLYAVQSRQTDTRVLLAPVVLALFGQLGDGRLIVATSQGGKTSIVSLRSDGSDVEQIATISGALTRARLSP